MDNEIKGEGNSYAFNKRLLDPRIGRWLSLDPVSKPYQGNYNFAENNPSIIIDPDGGDDYFYDMQKRAWMVRRTGAEHRFYYIDNIGDGDRIVMQKSIHSNEIQEHMYHNKALFHDAYQNSASFEELKKVWEAPDGPASRDKNLVGVVTVAAPVAVIAAVEAGPVVLLKEGAEYVWEEATGVPAPTDLKNLWKFGKKGWKFLRNKVFKSGNPCGCFSGETLILTENGYVELEKIKVGDLVWAYNEETKVESLQPVLETFITGRDKVYHIYVEESIIKATSDHPFFVNGSWVKAESLKIGDSLTQFNGVEVAIDEIKIQRGSFEVYNLIVKDSHTYFVSDQNILVHNGDPCQELVKNITEKYDLLECIQCAKEVADALKERGIKGKIVNYRTAARGQKTATAIHSDVAKNGISTSGLHRGVLVNGKVYDNVHKGGIDYEDWIKDMYHRGSDQSMGLPGAGPKKEGKDYFIEIVEEF